MSTRKHRDSQSVQPANGESPKPEAQGTSPSGDREEPAPSLHFLFWGLPLIFFIVIAVIKQCGD